MLSYDLKSMRLNPAPLRDEHSSPHGRPMRERFQSGEVNPSPANVLSTNRFWKTRLDADPSVFQCVFSSCLNAFRDFPLFLLDILRTDRVSRPSSPWEAVVLPRHKSARRFNSVKNAKARSVLYRISIKRRTDNGA